jgi:hypothetical protein
MSLRRTIYKPSDVSPGNEIRHSPALIGKAHGGNIMPGIIRFREGIAGTKNTAIPEPKSDTPEHKLTPHYRVKRVLPVSPGRSAIPQRMQGEELAERFGPLTPGGKMCRRCFTINRCRTLEAGFICDGCCHNDDILSPEMLPLIEAGGVVAAEVADRLAARNAELSKQGGGTNASISRN